MMDITMARTYEAQLDNKLNAIQQIIEATLTDYDNTVEGELSWDSVNEQLSKIEYDILSGDFGGYFQDYRPALIARIDTLRLRMGLIPPERPNYIFTQTIHQFFQHQYENGLN